MGLKDGNGCVGDSSTKQADGNMRSPAPAPVASILDMMAGTQKLADGAYATVAHSHQASGTSKRRVEYESGAKGKGVATLASISNVNDEDVVVVVKGKVAGGEKEAYGDSLKSMLHDYTDENCYKLEGNCYGIIVSNKFDNTESEAKFGDKYTKLFRAGRDQDRKQVKKLFQHLRIKLIGDHENVLSEELPEYIQEFREDAIENKAALVFVVVMSHVGLLRPDTVLMDDLEEVCAWKDIIYPLGGSEELRQIPKIFLFNMCRDSWDPWIPKTVEAMKEKVTSDSGGRHCERSLRDSLLLFSTLPYDVSLRSPYTASMYISEMYKVFMECAHKKTLWKMLYDVHMALLEKHGQTPAHQPFLFKNLKFRPRKQ